ncbi:putative peptide maturation dehydrogenase [Stenotrophomonas sp. 24(2023)]|uniref:putative peptide maturation dehydrogenase n=1 Tax=Stenotrophomonas sp. 24(2023) TaxID=3068324 RepID=UPI0027E01188|nr:putative peptide maturation dehydrogenase [Stenotrophomonas sp. 24(2023)]WMJ71276.1 putative peptide maturation dehydrogenase [Stenotrophomonas sp. 24(2023)]
MRIRRCAHLLLEPHDVVSVDLAALVRGSMATRVQPRWLARAAHQREPVEVDAEDMRVLGSIGAGTWMECPVGTPDAAIIAGLLEKGLLLSDDPAHRLACQGDEQLREGHWWTPMAVAHAHSRWGGVDSVTDMHARGLDTAAGLRRMFGPPPAAVHARPGHYQGLPLQEQTGFDALLAQRSTCRNFDTARHLPLPLLAQLLQRTVMAHAQVEVDADAVFLKKNVPSGGGLHATDVFLLVQRVQDLVPGLYHYHPVQHALLRLPSPAAADLPALSRRLLSGQQWFADAAVLLVLAPRFERSFWKYRDHSKAYRALVLDTGHIAQAVQTCATEAGLGAFITAAINEADVDAAFGLDGTGQGAVAVCGVGWRAAVRQTAEFDPPRVPQPA